MSSPPRPCAYSRARCRIIDPIGLLRDLIAIPSINPRDELSFARPFGETAVIDHLEDVLARSRFDVERQTACPGRDNLLARVDGVDPSRVLLLESHVDTVGVEGYRGDPFDPVLRDGRVYGRGSCDDKAQVAAMVAALADVTSSGRPQHTVLLVLAVGEEYNFTGARALVESGLGADGAVVGEPTELQVITAHKGAVRMRCITEGVAAHSSEPSAGVNAIYRMARVLAVLERHAGALVGRQPHARLGTPTLSVGTIAGGRDTNIVPDRCVISLDRRVLPSEDSGTVIAEIQRAVLDDPGLDFPVEFVVDLADHPMETPEGATITRSLCAACEAVRGHSQVSAVRYGTDASKFAAAGIPSVVFGAGSIRQAHTVDEYVEVEQVWQATAVLRRLLEQGLLG